MKRFALALAMAASVAATLASATGSEAGAEASPDHRPGALDLVILLDKSLSMEPFFDSVREYVAGKVIGPLLSPGDRLIIELVYGKVDRLFTGEIASDADIAAAVRSLRAVQADGRFTDLGAALDVAKRDLDELGKPERPKYVLLITDEVQEAPSGSPYIAVDNKLRHRALEYVARKDLGKFRAITVGFHVADRIALSAPRMLELLAAPETQAEMAITATGEARGSATAKSLPEEWIKKIETSPGTPDGTKGAIVDSAAGNPADMKEGESPQLSEGLEKERASPPGFIPVTLAVIAALGALAAIAFAVLHLVKKRDKHDDR